MKYVIGAILLLIALFIIGLIWRKKVYDEVDRLESWKMDIMNRRVTEELSKVKSLNLSGETQERFEKWRSRWDRILTKELPALEEDLFDAEEAADKYQWKRVKKVLADTEKKLLNIEEDIQKMFEELENLLDSEKNSRIEIESLEPELKELSKTLIHSRHQFGKAVYVFEKRVEELKGKLQQYEQLTEQGNYLEANSLVQSIRDELLILQDEIAYFPERYRKAHSELPDLLNELKSGIEEMEGEGYRISHLDYYPEIEKYEEMLKESVIKLEKADQSDVEELILEIETSIQEMYEVLENEAVAHNYVDKHYKPIQAQLDRLSQVLSGTERELEETQTAYQLDDQDVEAYRGIKSWYNQMKNKVSSVDHKRQDGKTAYTEIREQLELVKQQLDEIQEKHEHFNERIQTLRKDEVEAKTKLSNMEQLLLDTHRRLKRSNIPGIPTSIYENMKTASEQMDEAFQSLEKQPLDMVEVHAKLQEAAALTENLHEHAEKIMEKACYTERLIQYGNRYKSKYPILAARLLEAENEFRSYHYEEALEIASEAIKEVDPEALSRIEEKEQVLV
ncbi:septation ring formation regulator EzrA [Halobacillus sp. BBL2006]|uniref:septation ring formation regulator EzrA n=1 Tax=Halobacillus sp. BBL2006 TaxID=1543706 RepID=UPI000543C435|nr:septation ring formation regulator EzrA [Halobacillus sp. BBL2006]KHE68056.1 septation ring formation regulator EzrA [Halobacillus sp. BBL2006]